MALLRNLLKDRSGATAIEYALVASLIAVVIVTTLGMLSNSLTALYTTIGGAVAK